MPKGNLILIPTSLDPEAVRPTLLPEVLLRLNTLKYFVVENEKTARKFLKLAGITRPQSELVMLEYGKHHKASVAEYMEPLLDGHDLGMLSEAGCPAVADPGSDIVHQAHLAGIRVIPCVGPNSIVLALMASGFNGQSFVFHGYLPIDKAERKQKMKQMEMDASRFDQTQIWIETPFRNTAMLTDLVQHLNPATRLCVAAGLTTPSESIRSQNVQAWRLHAGNLGKIPAIFLLYVQGRRS